MTKKIKKLSKKLLKEKPKKLEEEKIKKTKVRVIGIGGGGGNIVSEIASKMRSSRYPISFAAANTDLQALKILNKNVLRFPFGEKFTHGLGSGMNQELAKEASINEKEKIKKLFQDQNFCIIISSLGGGTGSGAAPFFAKIAKDSGAITLGVFTLPFKFEGEKKQEIARESLQKLKSVFNALVVLPNDRIFQIIDKNTPLREALSAINKNLAESLEGLIETIYLPGLINIDFADLKTILQGQSRFAYLNSVEFKGAESALETIKLALNCPLYPYTIKGAKKVLFNIVGEKELSLSDVSQISKEIFEQVNPEAKIIFGISQNKKYKDKIKIVLLATGCTLKIFSEKIKNIKKIVKSKKLSLPSRTIAKGEEEKSFSATSQGTVKKGEEKSFSLISNKFKVIKKIIKSKKTLLKGKKKNKKEEEKKEKKKGIVKNKKSFIKIKKEKSKLKFKKNKLKIITKEKKLELPKIKEKKLSPLSSFVAPQKIEDKKEKNENEEMYSVSKNVKIRKNALQLKKEMEEVEKEFLEKEKIWETPAFLRKQQKI